MGLSKPIRLSFSFGNEILKKLVAQAIAFKYLYHPDIEAALRVQ